MLLFVTELRAGTKHQFSESLTGDKLAALFEGTEYTPAQDVSIDVEVERFSKRFRICASIRGDVKFECGRCLETISRPLSVDTEWELMSRSEWVGRYEDGDDEVELNEDDLNLSFYSGDEIELNELIREAILLELPAHPNCVENVEACDELYARNVGEEAIEENKDAGIDLRWGPLKDIKLKT